MNSCCMFMTGNKGLDKYDPNNKPYLGAFSEVISTIKEEKEKVLNFEVFYSYIPRNFYKIHEDNQNENQERELLIGCTLKSKLDGIGNRNCPIDFLIAVDVSGSMSASVGGDCETRMSLAIKSTMKIIEKLGKDDRAGVVSFNNACQIVGDLNYKDEILKSKSDIQELVPAGGTTISSVINLTRTIFEDSKIPNSKRQKRLILLTDMNDAGNDEDLIEGILNLSKDNDVFTTVIGIGESVDIILTEKVSKARGFNYLTINCYNDLENNVLKNFDMLFFPLALDIALSIESGDIEVKKIYGTNYDNKVQLLEQGFALKGTSLYSPLTKVGLEALMFKLKKKYNRVSMPIIANFLDFLSYDKKIRNICEISSCSATDKISNNKQKGKFFIVVCKLKDSKLLNQFNNKISCSFTLKYKNADGIEKAEIIKNQYKINDLNKVQEDPLMHNGLCLFYYNKFYRDILRKKSRLSNRLSNNSFEGNNSLVGNNGPGVRLLRGIMINSPNRAQLQIPDPLNNINNGNLLDNQDFLNDEFDNNVDEAKISEDGDKDYKKAEASIFLEVQNLKKCYDKLISFFKDFENADEQFVKNIFKDLDEYLVA